jgi:hypothetical protein
MPAWVNQNSFVLAAGAAFLVIAIWLLRDGVRWGDLLALGAVALGLWAAHALLRPPAGDSADAASIHAEIGAGVPVLIEFQSPY